VEMIKRACVGCFALLLLASLCNQANAQQSVNVTANGYGDTEGEALVDLLEDIELWIDTFSMVPGIIVVDVEYGDIERVLCEAPEPWHLRQPITLVYITIGGPNPNGN
jgi:hypothetical protein